MILEKTILFWETQHSQCIARLGINYVHTGRAENVILNILRKAVFRWAIERSYGL